MTKLLKSIKYENVKQLIQANPDITGDDSKLFDTMEDSRQLDFAIHVYTAYTSYENIGIYKIIETDDLIKTLLNRGKYDYFFDIRSIEGKPSLPFTRDCPYYSKIVPYTTKKDLKEVLSKYDLCGKFRLCAGRSNNIPRLISYRNGDYMYCFEGRCFSLVRLSEQYLKSERKKQLKVDLLALK